MPRQALWGKSKIVTVGGATFRVPAARRFSKKELRALAAQSKAMRSYAIRKLLGLCRCGKEKICAESESLGTKCLLKARREKRRATGVVKPYKKD